MAQVNIDDVNIVNNSYANYGIHLKVVVDDRDQDPMNDDNQVLEDRHIYKRFSEFLELKRRLEKEFNSELPYELPSRHHGPIFNVWTRSTTSICLLYTSRCV